MSATSKVVVRLPAHIAYFWWWLSFGRRHEMVCALRQMRYLRSWSWACDWCSTSSSLVLLPYRSDASDDCRYNCCSAFACSLNKSAWFGWLVCCLFLHSMLGSCWGGVMAGQLPCMAFSIQSSLVLSLPACLRCHAT